MSGFVISRVQLIAQPNLIILPLHEGGIFIPKIKESEEKHWIPKRKLPKRRRSPLPQRSRRTSPSPKRSPPKTSRRTITARQRSPMRARRRTRRTISPKKRRISPNLSLYPPFPMQRTRRF